MRHFAIPALFAFLAGPSFATTVDFTSAAWDGANPAGLSPTTTFTETNVGAIGIDVTATLLVGTTLLNNTVNGPSPAPAPIPPDLPNGLGIFTLIGDTDSSEVSDNEILRITFSSPVTVDSILFSKLFTIASGKDSVDEEARWSFDGGATMMFVANTVDQEGRHSVATPGAVGVTSIDFFTQGGDHDFSLVSIDFTLVPEPTLLALVGCLGLVAVGSRRRIA